MALKFGSKSGSGYTRSAFPMQSGTVNHASALKETEGERLAAERATILAENEAAKEQSKLMSKFRTEQEKNKVTTEPSEKTKNLKDEVDLQDAKTELHKQRSEKAKDISALGSEGRKEARKKGESDKLGRGLFGGYLKRKKVQRKYKKSQKKEDKSREQLAKSEAWDKLTPDEKTAKQREKMAYLTAMFDSDARTMHDISKGQFNVASQNKQRDKRPSKELKSSTRVQSLKGTHNWLEGIGNWEPTKISTNVNKAYSQKPGAGGEEQDPNLV